MADCCAEECGHGLQHRKVYLPLEKLDKCAVCTKAKGTPNVKLTLCSACAERIYCSPECQKKDWPQHKLVCGKTDRIDLESFYPYFAILAELLQHLKPPHFAQKHPIINDVNPTFHPTKLPDGWEAKVCIVDDTKEWMDPNDPNRDGDIMRWFPKAQSPEVAVKLMYRIFREGHTLPILISVGLAILSEIYTTKSGAGSQERRTRLKYKSSPIADFGIVKGSAQVTNGDKLAYMKLSDGSITHGQDPDDHYWLYFTTIRGEDITLDFGMFTFNMCTMVPTGGYIPQDAGDVSAMIPYAPVFFEDRVIQNTTPALRVETRRMSILRNKRLHDAIRHTRDALYDCDIPVIHAFMRAMSEKRLTDVDKDLVCEGTMEACCKLAHNLNRRTWTTYPPTAPLGVYGDPGELNGLDDRPVPNFRANRRRARRSRA